MSRQISKVASRCWLVLEQEANTFPWSTLNRERNENYVSNESTSFVKNIAFAGMVLQENSAYGKLKVVPLYQFS